MARKRTRRAGWAAGLVLALAAAAAGARADDIRIDTAQPPPLTAAFPIPPQRIDAAIGRLDDLARDLLRATGVPGLAVVVARDGETVYAKGFGVREAGKSAPVDADTVFQLASVSKALGATVVAHQVGQGVVSWDTRVVAHLPWFALGDPWVTSHLTIADLYSHRSGLPDHGGDALEDLGYDRRQVLERLRHLPLAPFRISYAYTNFGLTAAAEAVAAASGRDWASLSEAVLYAPLGMGSTSSRFADYMARANRAVPHVQENGVFVPKYQRDPDAQSPAGGVSSSARDLGRWLAFVLDGGRFAGRRLVPEAALLPAITAQIVSSPSGVPAARPGFYGHGFGVSVAPSARVMLSHSGAFLLGAATNFVMLPSERLGIAVLSNAAPVGAVEALAMEFMDLAEFGTITRNWRAAYAGLMAPMFKPLGVLAGQARPGDAAPPRALAAYAGTYANSYFGPAEVRVADGGLELLVGPRPERIRLAPWDKDVFTFRPSGENAPQGTVSQVTFALAGDEARTMTIEFLDENGLGTFSRQ